MASVEVGRAAKRDTKQGASVTMPPTISAYYRAALEQLKKEVEATPDDRVIGMSPDEWVDYLVRKWGMTPIMLDDSRSEGMLEVEQEQTLRGYDIYTDMEPGTIIRSTAVRVEVPVVPSDTIEEIWKHRLAPNSFHLTRYPEFDYDSKKACFALVVEPGAREVQGAIEKVKAGVRSYNESIETESPGFRTQAIKFVSSKRSRVEQKHKDLDALAASVGIPLTKKVDPATVVPTAPKVRTKIAPLLPPASRPPTRPVLEPAKFDAILELLDNGCRQFERTPQAFGALTEEGLRDVMLGNLNTVFEGAAGGETFQGIGKVDIHLRISQGEVFVAEVKVWDGPSSLCEVVGQLRGRLTWRDSYGVALLLSRNADFSEVLRSLREAIPSVEGFAPGSYQEKATNHFAMRFTIVSDPARLANINVLVYNLFVPERTGRAVTRRKKRL